MTLQEYQEIIKAKMGRKRYIHSVNVSSEAGRLAEKYGANREKAKIAGMLHDITKEMPFDEQLQMIKANDIILTNVQKTAPKLWHAITGALYLKNELSINDEEILSALRFHTTGRAGMTLLEKIVFVADFTSAERDYEDVDIMREKAEKSLDEAMLYGTSFSIKDLVNRGLTIDENTLALYNELIIKINNWK